ncbi:MAG: hypothetical protein V1847_02185 [Candidatus Diapherotrites archaeon]
MKVFRAGTKGAVKVVYWNYGDSVQSDEIRSRLFEKIRLLSDKNLFDPLEIFQHVSPTKGNARVEYYTDPLVEPNKGLSAFFKKVNEGLLCFSGNLSWINVKEGSNPLTRAFERMLERGVSVKILCRIDVATLKNLHKIESLMRRFPKQVEIRHCHQPLRGFVADGKLVRLKEEKAKNIFKAKELEKDVRVFYEFSDEVWTQWLEQVFWYLFRHSIEYEKREKLLEKFLIK